ncbi:MAG: GyrI-like domain-containing protein [Gemmatimonadales bacterium]
MKKIELMKQFRELYTAKRTVQEVAAERATFLAVNGRGKPGGEQFRNSIEMLYAIAYTTKFALKQARILDFKVPRLECLWLVDDPERTPPTDWEWRLLIRIPDDVTQSHVREARRILREEKGLDCTRVRRVSWREGRALQVLHVGPYEGLHQSYTRLQSRARELGYRVKGPGHEVYLSDPRRTAPERLKTIVRMPVSLPRPSYARGRSARSRAAVHN